MKYRTMLQILIVVFGVLYVDVLNFMADKIRVLEEGYDSKVFELESRLRETVIAREVERDQYKVSLLEIASSIYSNDQYWVGGFNSDTEFTVDSLYSAVMNKSVDYQDLLMNVHNYFGERSEYIRDIPNIWPLEYNRLNRITSGFGYRISPISGRLTFHGGIDLSGVWNAKVIVSADGVVIENSSGHPKYGNFVRVQHDYGFETRYAHMSYVGISKGQILNQGDLIGYIGDTGQSIGRHLHYEIWKDGEQVDPLDYLRF